MKKLSNFPGKRYGKLTLIKIIRTEIYLGVKRNIWLCQCDCGNIKEINSHTLRPNKSKSCGCSQKEHAKLLGKANIGRNGNSAKNIVISGYKSQMKTIKREWTITDSEAEKLFTGNCYYCGQIPTNIKTTKSGVFIYGGIDRIDSSKGYITGNVVSCCWPCNNMKGIFSKEDFLAHIQKINEYQTSFGRGELQFQV